MDTLTHALSGALIARATAPRAKTTDTLPLGRRMLVGALAAAFPDLDFITSYLTPLAYLYHHRGITHSLLLLPLWTVLLSFVFALIWRGRSTPDPTRGRRDLGPSWRAYLGITAYGIAAHIAGDLITSFGTMIFAPLSDARYALSATFIIDLWFTGIILAGLAVSAIWRSSRVPAAIGLAVLAGYVGLQVLLRQHAIDFGEQYAREKGIERAVVTAQPRPVSPFNWTVVIAEPDRYTYAHVNLIRKTAPPEPDARAGFIERLDAAYRPLSQAAWVPVQRYGSRDEDAALAREAYIQPAFAFFRWFAAYPAVLGIDSGNPERCVWFHDLRFATPGRDGTPFRYGMCRAGSGAWAPFQLLGNVKRAVY
jgi:inner membrane protein